MKSCQIVEENKKDDLKPILENPLSELEKFYDFQEKYALECYKTPVLKDILNDGSL